MAKSDPVADLVGRTLTLSDLSLPEKQVAYLSIARTTAALLKRADPNNLQHQIYMNSAEQVVSTNYMSYQIEKSEADSILAEILPTLPEDAFSLYQAVSSDPTQILATHIYQRLLIILYMELVMQSKIIDLDEMLQGLHKLNTANSESIFISAIADSAQSDQ